MFKSIIAGTAVIAAMAIPVLASAQDNGQVSRPEVKAGLSQMEQSGYRPESDRAGYPDNVQASERSVQTQRGGDAASYGPAMTGTSAAGVRNYSAQPDRHAVYLGH